MFHDDPDLLKEDVPALLVENLCVLVDLVVVFLRLVALELGCLFLSV